MRALAAHWHQGGQEVLGLWLGGPAATSMQASCPCCQIRQRALLHCLRSGLCPCGRYTKQLGSSQLNCYWKHNWQCRSLLTGRAHGTYSSWRLPAFPSSLWSMHCCHVCCSRPGRSLWGDEGCWHSRTHTIQHRMTPHPRTMQPARPVCCCSDTGAFCQGTSAGHMTFGSCTLTRPDTEQSTMRAAGGYYRGRHTPGNCMGSGCLTFICSHLCLIETPPFVWYGMGIMMWKV